MTNCQRYAFTGIFLLVFGCGPDRAKIAQLFETASRDFAAQNTADARAGLNQILDLDPDHTNARILLGRIYYYEKNYAAAEAEFQAAWDYDASSIDGLLWLARAQSLQPADAAPGSGPAAAIQTLEMLVEKDPGNPAAWYLLGTLYEGERQIDRAMAAYRYGLAAGQNLGAIHLRLGELYGKAGLAAQARPHFEAAEIFSRSDTQLARRVAAARAAYLK